MAEFPSGKTLDGGLAMPIQCPSFEPGLPAYLRQTYWWAYLDPRAVRFFDQQVIVNSILWGNFVRLKEAALAEVDPLESARMLQVACVYGDFTPSLASRMGAGSHLDVVDVAPIQLRNLERKLESQDQVNLHLQDASKLGFADESFDQVQVFFLLHELPDAVRRKAVREALRKQVRQIKSTYNVDSVKFRIVVEEGRAKVKAVPQGAAAPAGGAG